MPGAVKIPLSAGAILPRDMDARQHSEYMASQGARHVRTTNATGYNVGEGVWYGADTDGTIKLFVGNASGNKILWDGSTLTVVGNITLQANSVGEDQLQDGSVSGGKLQADSVTADKIDVAELSAITADLGSITAGDIVLPSGGFIRSGQTAYNTGTGWWIGNDGGTPKFSFGNSSGNRVTWDGTDLAVVGTLNGSSVTNLAGLSTDLGAITAGSIVLPSGGFIRSGQTAYDTGTGFYLGNDSGTPKFSIGAAAGNKLTWDGSALAITGAVNLTNSAATFTPASWTGFSADPSGDISYLDLGAIVFMWRDTALTGTSDDVGMTFTGIPTALRPSAGNKIVRCLVVNGSFTLGGAVEITTSGIAQFYIEDVSGGGAGTADDNKVTPQGSGFANTGTKGIPAGWLITYPK